MSSSPALDDPDFIRFLDHLSPDSTGRAYVLRIKGGPTVEYERDDADKHNNKKKREDDEMWTEILVNDNSDPVDSDYLTVLQNLMASEDNNSLLFNFRNNVGQEELHSSNLNPSPYSEEEEVMGSVFERKLMRIERRPFDEREYKRLMKLATVRKPVVKYKHLRTDDIPYETEQLGASYFDYYPELKRKVERVDHFSGLKLLRGFFFWLKNVEHEGVYKPWLSASSNCRTPPSRSHGLFENLK